ncbi:MAG: hypothetical protein IJU95_05365, partial [Treponema sp.]|nr:hypothetical protein [Treponema sp.]
LKGYDPASTHVVIAAFDFPAAESLLRKLGFHDYSIYIYDRGWLKLPDPAASRVKYMLGRDGEDV